MTGPAHRIRRGWLRGPSLSPAGFIRLAGIILAAFTLMHLAGWREYTAVFSGTLPEDTRRRTWAVVFAGLYTAFYLAAILVVPILVMAAAFLHLLFRRMTRHWPGDSERTGAPDPEPSC